VILSHNRFTLVDRSADELFTRAVELGVGVLNAAVYGGGILARPHESTKYSYKPASRELLETIAAMDSVCTRYGIDLATAALQFSLRDPRIDATVVGITSEGRISSLIASAGLHIPDAAWDELELLVPPASLCHSTSRGMTHAPGTSSAAPGPAGSTSERGRRHHERALPLRRELPSRYPPASSSPRRRGPRHTPVRSLGRNPP